MEGGEARQRRGEPSRRWAFGPAVLDERSLELTVNGVLARLERKPLEVLQYLLRHAGEVVTKEELAESIWPGRILTETVLTRCIGQLRQVLGDDERALIRTIHGFGYRLVAEVRVDAAPVAAPPSLDLKVGDRPPSRPQWRLEERLGSGGHGEAWLARHEKTHEARVFKFALDASALASLKREITLSRLIFDSLGDRAAAVRILEWNLEEAPCFIESEYVAGRDLRAWAEAQGGIAEVPLERRLDLVAQIAEALAAAHSVGVLHKDPKPGNVLIATDADGRPRVKLCDFGSGGVMDSARLEALGITRLGFTKSTGADDGTSATPLYLAPEVAAGQPFTVGADIYALGVMLYQLAVGDLRKTLALGWELNVEDELLREDIALAAAGEPARRLLDAGQLAERLRSLDSRRHVRAAKLAAQERADRARRALAELRRTRAFAAAVLLLAIAAGTGGVAAHRARGDALAARATAEAVNDFLMDDVLRIDPKTERPKDATYESLLMRAAGQVKTRFKHQPEAAANVHWLLGRRLQEAGRIDAAAEQYESASEFLRNPSDRVYESSLLATDRLIPIYVNRGLAPRALTLGEDLIDKWTRLHGPRDMSTLLVRARLARQRAFAGDFRRAESELRAISQEIPRAAAPGVRTHEYLTQSLGISVGADVSALTQADLQEALAAHVDAMLAAYLVQWADNYGEGITRFRGALAGFRRLLPKSELEMASLLSLGFALGRTGAYGEAEDLILQGTRLSDSMLPPGHWQFAMPKFFLADLRLHQGRANQALALLREALEICVRSGCVPFVTEEIRYGLGQSYLRIGDTSAAVSAFRGSLAAVERQRGEHHLDTLRRRVSLADALRLSGDVAEARATLAAIPPESLRMFQHHTILADFLRVEGLLSRGDEPAKAAAALQQALEIYRLRFGDSHWDTERLRAELVADRVPAR
jgi:eukaryotic-like serine/threonine-protein kinase